MRHQTLCTLYELAEIQRKGEARLGLSLTDTGDIVAHLRERLFPPLETGGDQMEERAL